VSPIDPLARQVYALDRLSTFLDEIEDLVELGGEEIERGEDGAVWAQVVPLGDSLSCAVALRGRAATAHCFMTSW
jgi:hypothetical protein